MKRSQFSEHKILRILNEAEGGASMHDVCRQHGISPSSFYRWKAKYSGMEVSDIRRLKQMYADLSLDHEALKDLLAVKL